MSVAQITVHGKPDLIKGLSKMFAPVEGGKNFEGVCVGGMCIAIPQDEITSIPCQISVRCVETKKSFKTAGFASPSFMHATTLSDSKVTIGNTRMSRRRKVSYHTYVIDIN